MGFIRKGGVGHNPVPKEKVPKAKPGDKIRILDSETARDKSKEGRPSQPGK